VELIAMTDGSLPTFACPQCGRRRAWKPEYSVKRVKCSCGSVFVAPAKPEAAEEDEYDIAPDPAAPPKPSRPAPMAATQPPQAKPVVAYRSAAPKAVARPGRMELDDPWEGDKFRNLYFPAALVVGASLFNIIVSAYFLKDASLGLRNASIKMAMSLLVEIPVMLLACVLAVKLLDAAFGPLGPAILKLSSIALAPDALQWLLILIGLWIGGSGGLSSLNVGGVLGALLGWILSLVLYFWLFTYYFDMTVGEAYRLIILIWLIRMIGVGFIRHFLSEIM
jgi:hypothetical protein